MHHHSPVGQVHQDDGQAWAVTNSGELHTGAALVGADGYRSVVRPVVAADRPDVRFAGYGLWLGVADERASACRGDRRPGLPGTAASTSCSATHCSRRTAPGHREHRRLGWAWYDATRSEPFRRAGAGQGSVVRHSLSPTDIPPEIYAQLAADAGRRWPAPWSPAIADSIVRRDVTAPPISEYLPTRLVAGGVGRGSPCRAGRSSVSPASARVVANSRS